MADKLPPKAGTVFIVSEILSGRWHEILSTKDQAQALDLLKTLGDKGRIEELLPWSKRR